MHSAQELCDKKAQRETRPEISEIPRCIQRIRRIRRRDATVLLGGHKWLHDRPRLVTGRLDIIWGALARAQQPSTAMCLLQNELPQSVPLSRNLAVVLPQRQCLSRLGSPNRSSGDASCRCVWHKVANRAVLENPEA